MPQLVLVIAAVVLPWFLIAMGGWLLLQLIRQNGRILLRMEAISTQLEELGAAPHPRRTQDAAAPPPQGLPLGSTAPPFELPDLAGKRRSLAEFRGRRVLLVFFGPHCGFCTEMLPRLAALSASQADGAPALLVVSSGTAQENRRLFRAHGIHSPILLQKQFEVAGRYQALGTPVGYLIDEQGAIAGGLAVGAEAVLALAGNPAPGGTDTKGSTDGKARPYGGNRPLSSSRLVRDGLKAGAPAPPFRLPRVGGGEVVLEDYRGRRVLLVFSDPECGPCDALAPQLEALHRRATGLQIVMVSRRDPEANRKKVAEHGLTFPVAIQKNWDTSKDYGMFATPIAYLVDERAMLAADVAVGADAILELALRSSSQAGAAASPPRNGDSEAAAVAALN